MSAGFAQSPVVACGPGVALQAHAAAVTSVESLNLALLSLLRATPWKLSLARPMAWVIGARDCPGAGEGCNDGRIQGVGRMLRGILGSRAAKNTLLVVTQPPLFGSPLAWS
ncbi:hypothetical protein FNF28_03633 [Cafeteria roenbergensis]|uniref:Uncharacterized protein n=1 Tax=Cafeteria roenbergensis TaxID=33653 RepID=A0A5A8DIG4_CAFRO|nr:hypothetical protein FNF28_03633 [Cafeteria roenbergensis]